MLQNRSQTLYSTFASINKLQFNIINVLRMATALDVSEVEVN